MQSVNPTPGEYRIAIRSYVPEDRPSRTRRDIVQGTLLCGGIFGVRFTEEENAFTLTQTGTGRTAGHYATQRKAYMAASRLITLPLPWGAKTVKEWRAGLGDKQTVKGAIEIIEKYGYR
jgi:hypothetical protein